MSRLPPVPLDWAVGWGQDGFGFYADMAVGAVVQRFRWCPLGSFVMGSPIDEPGRYADEGPQLRVRLTQGFWLADTPVTQALWTATGRKNPSRFVHERRPVEQVNWHEATAFCAELGCALPTEAQWEYACRAGTTTALYTGPIEILGDTEAPALDPIAWYDENSSQGYDLKDGSTQGTRIVATRQANPWGLFDTLGNVYEWCRDSQRRYTADAVDDPVDESGGGRVIRGGSWAGRARDVRAAYRGSFVPGEADFYLGFRLLRGLPAPRGGAEEATEPTPTKRQ
jgi:formylglycine-generating enzyme required for sulfatase activity